MAWELAPLWLTIATGPSRASSSWKMVEKFATTPVAKLARPWPLGKIFQAGKGAQPLDGGAARIDRVDRAAVAVALHIKDRPAADLVRVVRGADDGDRARREGGLQHGGGIIRP